MSYIFAIFTSHETRIASIIGRHSLTAKTQTTNKSKKKKKRVSKINNKNNSSLNQKHERQEPQLRIHLNPTRSIFEFTRFSRAPRNLIGYSVRDALTAQDPMHRSRKPWNTEAVAVTDPASYRVPYGRHYRDYRRGPLFADNEWKKDGDTGCRAERARRDYRVITESFVSRSLYPCTVDEMALYVAKRSDNMGPRFFYFRFRLRSNPCEINRFVMFFYCYRLLVLRTVGA